ncbi:hypothetical protein KKF91_03895 [Myxococcota bacterium]|nr:hypothetical protein [Myxococcota bacterium]MBU1429686.1 hypothetical protein [Myxococcota bacterium]MBU1898621.1 hypothetical protein [Myxococcota bacterium]
MSLRLTPLALLPALCLAQPIAQPPTTAPVIAPAPIAAPAPVALNAEGIWRALGQTHNTCKDEYDYFPHGGPRIFGCHLRALISLPQLSALAGTPIFIAGPHTPSALNLAHASEFGQYHPAFARWVADQLIPRLTTPEMRMQAQPIYDQYVKSLATSFYITYRKIQKEPDCFHAEIARYKRFLQGSQEQDMPTERYFFFMNPKFCSNPDGNFDFFYKNGFDVDSNGNVIKSCFSWWVRRTLDGTAPDFWRGLTKLIKAYDPALINKIH